MAMLPEDPRDQYRLLGIFLLVALAAVYWLYVHRPRGDELAELRERVETIEHHNELAEARMEDLESLRREVEVAERQFVALERLVPSRAEVPAIYEEIASESQSLGLELINVVPTEPQADTAGYFMRQRWQMEVEGEYHDIGAFLARVASFPRIVRPDVEELRPTRQIQGGRQMVGARFELETYVLPPSSGQAGRGEDED